MFTTMDVVFRQDTMNFPLVLNFKESIKKKFRLKRYIVGVKLIYKENINIVNINIDFKKYI